MSTEKDQPVKQKESVRLRQRPAANGNISLYLDSYWKGERSKESLNLFLIPELTKKDKIKNEVTLELAEKIQAQRLTDLQHGKFKMRQAQAGASFIEYVAKLARERLNSKGNYGNWDSALKHIKNFAEGKDITFQEVDEASLAEVRQQARSLRGNNERIMIKNKLFYVNIFVYFCIWIQDSTL